MIAPSNELSPLNTVQSFENTNKLQE